MFTMDAEVASGGGGVEVGSVDAAFSVSPRCPKKIRFGIGQASGTHVTLTCQATVKLENAGMAKLTRATLEGTSVTPLPRDSTAKGVFLRVALKEFRHFGTSTTSCVLLENPPNCSMR